MNFRFSVFFGCVLVTAVGFFCSDSASAKSPETICIPHGVLMVDSPPPRLLLVPTISAKDTSTSLHPVIAEPVNTNPAQTVNPE